MEFIPMILGVLGIVFISKILDEKLNILTPLSIIALTFGTYYFSHYQIVHLDNRSEYAVLIYALLPLLLLGDALNVKIVDVKKHIISLTMLAGVALVVSIFIGYEVMNIAFPEYQLRIVDVIILFAMVLPTDPVSVISVFDKFKLPHSLKFHAEGESLLNDGVAVAIFHSVGLAMLAGDHMGIIDMGFITIKSLIISGIIGLIIGFIGVGLLSLTVDRIKEFILILIVAYGSFFVSEHYFHVSGIFSIIVSIVTLNFFIERTVEEEIKESENIQNTIKKTNLKKNVLNNFLNKIKTDITDIARIEENKKLIGFLGLFANALIFIGMAEMISIDLLIQYKVEIFLIFFITTTIRFFMVGGIALISNKTDKMANINFRWTTVLWLSGIKGGLSIAMITMIPETYKFKEMFSAIVIGNVLLSTFIFSISLMLFIGKYKKEFSDEADAEHSKH